MKFHKSENGVSITMNWPVDPRAIERRRAECQAEADLLIIARPEDIARLMVEVDRRANVMKETWEAYPVRNLTHTARAAALRSVASDVARGWL